MNPKFKGLEWVLAVRHGRYDHSTQLVTEKGVEPIKLLAKGIKRYLMGDDHKKKIAIFHSQTLRAVHTALLYARNLPTGIPMIGLNRLEGDDYTHGEGHMEAVLEILPEGVKGVIIVGHFEAVPGIIDAFSKIGFDVRYECYEPCYSEGAIINLETGVINNGLDEYFRSLDEEELAETPAPAL